MKKDRIIALLCFLFLMFFSCKDKKHQTVIKSDTAKIITLSSFEQSFQDTTFFKSPKIIVLETTDESLLAEISRIISCDSLLFIFDDSQDQLFVFDITGKYIQKINHKGQGPKEYNQICDFTVDSDKKQIILSADRPAKLMYYTYDCKFIKEENQPMYYPQLVKDRNLFYFIKDSRLYKNQVHILNTETGIKTESLEMLDIKNNLFLKGNSLTRGQNILFVRRYDNSIYELINEDIIKKYHFDFKKHSLPERFIKESDERIISRESRENKYIYSMSNVFNGDRYMMFYTNVGIFIYDMLNETLIGYENMKITYLKFVMAPYDFDFDYYLPLENTDKIVFFIEDPLFIKRIVERNPDKLKQDKDYLELMDIVSKMTDDNNPILFIYDFKD